MPACYQLGTAQIRFDKKMIIWAICGYKINEIYPIDEYENGCVREIKEDAVQCSTDICLERWTFHLLISSEEAIEQWLDTGIVVGSNSDQILQLISKVPA